ncbi:hypothetical protein M378DRAFT_165783, partial [Amanita muscaria Koide BX008]
MDGMARMLWTDPKKSYTLIDSGTARQQHALPHFILLTFVPQSLAPFLWTILDESL